MENIGNRLYSLRKQRGLTLEEVATGVGSTKSTVRKWEKGIVKNMKRDKIISVSKFFGVTPEYLMGWKEESSDVIALSEDEKNLIKLFRSLDEDHQELFRQMLDVAIRNT